MPRGIAVPLSPIGKAIVVAFKKWHKGMDDPDITLNISSTQKKIEILHKNVHVINLEFRWSKERFLGKFVDRDGFKTQSCLSFEVASELKDFAILYDILIRRRAANRT